MSLRCSLLGHEYGEREIERDREERGNEVVISVVELERCVHCGTTRTISENTEVTQLSGSRSAPAESSPDPPDSEPDAGAGPGIQPRPDAVSDRDPSAGPDAETNGESEGRADRRPEAAPRFEADPDPAAEDAEIIEDDAAGEPDRDPGAWPEVDEDDGRVDDAPGAWPSVEGEDEGFDASAPDPDGPTDVEFGGGLAPQADQGAEILEADAGDGDPTFVSAGSTPASDRRAESDGRALFCPNCGTSGLERRESLRAGDICPECHRGYLAGGEP